MASIRSIYDTWDANVVSTTIWPSSFGNVSAVSGQLNLTCIPSGYQGVDSAATTYSLIGQQASIQLINAGNQTFTSLEVFHLQLFADASNKLKWYLNQNTLQAKKVVATVETQVGGNLAYVAGTHNYFRIREMNGTTYWDWSTDGFLWNNLTSVANPITLTTLQIELTAGTFSAEAGTTTVIYDNFNILPDNGFILNNMRPRVFAPGLAR